MLCAQSGIMPKLQTVGRHGKGATIKRSARKTCSKCKQNKSAGHFNTTQFTSGGIRRDCMKAKLAKEGRLQPNKAKYPKCALHGLHHKCSGTLA